MIRVKSLTKYYGKRLAVDNISFIVENGGWTLLPMEAVEMSLEDVSFKLITEEEEE